ncbi:MAG: SDR family oxidoreductase [Actinomycetia bacterium]|nr:SDR family oxidoreductase [Actinomycetes bacterium]
MRLANKVAIVTGASRGMGAEIAVALAREGADVVLAARTLTEAEVGKPTRPGTTGEVAARIHEMGRRALAVKTDITIKADVENLVQTTLNEFGRIDILVNSAWFVNFEETPLSDLLDADKTDATVATFKGTLDITRAVLQHMVECKSGTIINITSMGAKTKVPNAPVYAGLKAGVTHFTASAAAAVARQGVRINCVAPGIIDTASTHDTIGDSLDMALQMLIPMGRLGRESDIANAVIFLADDATSNYITGTTLTVDGGISHF